MPHPQKQDYGQDEQRYECPYTSEIHLVQRLEKSGIEEQAIIGRRRDRISAILMGSVLAAVLALGGGALAGGLGVARDVGRADQRINHLEQNSSTSNSTAVEIGRVGAKLEAIEQRLLSIENRLTSTERANAVARSGDTGQAARRRDR